jgi:hypothetical protein
MAYLMRDQSHVYYNSLFFKPNVTAARDFRENEFFPPEWQKLVMAWTKIFVESRSTNQ